MFKRIFRILQIFILITFIASPIWACCVNEPYCRSYRQLIIESPCKNNLQNNSYKKPECCADYHEFFGVNLPILPGLPEETSDNTK